MVGVYQTAIEEFRRRRRVERPSNGILQAVVGFSVAYPNSAAGDVLTPLGLEEDAAMSRAAVRSCRGNEAVLLRGYSSAMPGPRDQGGTPNRGVYVIGWPDERGWLAHRFTGAPPVGNCGG